MKRYTIPAAPAAMQMCLGATCSRSVFMEPMGEPTGLFRGPVQAPFTLFYFPFPGTMMPAGTPLPGPRRCAAIGGGWMLGGLGVHNLGFTIPGVGLKAGIGVGMAPIFGVDPGVSGKQSTGDRRRRRFCRPRRLCCVPPKGCGLWRCRPASTAAGYWWSGSRPPRAIGAAPTLGRATVGRSPGTFRPRPRPSSPGRPSTTSATSKWP